MTKKKIIFIISIVLVIVILVVCGVIKIYNGPQENCVFISERANLHNEYYITVTDISSSDSVLVLKNQDDTEKSEIIGNDKHFVIVNVKIEHQSLASPNENEKLDLNDFIIKDHTGVQVKNFNFFSKENGLALETINFTKKEPIKDYTWFNHDIPSGETLEIDLYFEFPKKLSATNTLMVLETDLYAGRKNGKAGTDIVLAYRENNQI